MELSFMEINTKLFPPSSKDAVASLLLCHSFIITWFFWKGGSRQICRRIQSVFRLQSGALQSSIRKPHAPNARSLCQLLHQCPPALSSESDSSPHPSSVLSHWLFSPLRQYDTNFLLLARVFVKYVAGPLCNNPAVIASLWICRVVYLQSISARHPLCFLNKYSLRCWCTSCV